jgi:amino acid permease
MVTTPASSRAIVFNLIMMGLGTGILTMPWGVAGASILNSLAILALVLVMNVWTVMILIRECDARGVYDLGGLLKFLPGALGPWCELAGNCTVWGSQVLVLIGYTIVIRDSLFELQPSDQPLLSKPLLTVLVGFITCPLSFLNQADLSFTSVIGIIANVFLFGLLIFYALNPSALPAEVRASEEDRFCLLGFADGFVTMFSLLMYTMIITMAMPPMYEELEGRTPEKFYKCLVVAFAILYFLFAAIMISGYVAFGSGVGSSVLDSLPRDALGSTARFGMAMCILGCYPLNVIPMVAPFLRANKEDAMVDEREPLVGEMLDIAGRRATLRELSASGFKMPGGFIPTFTIVASCTVASLWLTSLGPLNAVNGAIQVAGYLGLMPGMTGLYLSRDVGKMSMYLLMAFALTTSVLGFIFIDNDKDALDASCLWAWSK